MRKPRQQGARLLAHESCLPQLGRPAASPSQAVHLPRAPPPSCRAERRTHLCIPSCPACERRLPPPRRRERHARDAPLCVCVRQLAAAGAVSHGRHPAAIPDFDDAVARRGGDVARQGAAVVWRHMGSEQRGRVSTWRPQELKAGGGDAKRASADCRAPSGPGAVKCKKIGRSGKEEAVQGQGKRGAAAPHLV
jgi:hypothetical protein